MAGMASSIGIWLASSKITTSNKSGSNGRVSETLSGLINQMGFKVRDLNMHDGITQDRFDRRRSMLGTVDEHFRSLEKSDALSAMDSFYQSAYALVSSQKAREAFDLASEPEKIRLEYGKHDAGQRMLMARRLVESGVRFVSVTFGGWDMHAGIARAWSASSRTSIRLTPRSSPISSAVACSTRP